MMGIAQFCFVCCTVLYINYNIILYFTLATVLNQRTSMAGLKNSSPGFAYAIDSKEGGYVLKISNAAAIVVRNEVTGQFEVDLRRCPPICPNLPYAEIYVTMPQTISDGTEAMIMRFQAGPNGDLWIRKDGPNHS